MSGHSGFQPIGSNLPPIISQPQVGNVQGPGQAQEPQPPDVSGGNEPSPDYETRLSNARSLALKLDAMLIQAARTSTCAVGHDALKSAMSAANLGKDDRKALTAAALKAQEAMKAVSGLTGRKIAEALVADQTGVFDWKKGSAAAKAIRNAIDAQAELSELFTDLANRPDISGDAFEALSELALQCDRRQSEISTLAMQLADAVASSGDDPALAARLDAKLSELLPKQALSMHGNTEVLDRLKAQLQPLADRLEAFAARPAASISSDEFMAYAVEVKDASAAISRALKEGFPAPGGGRILPDRNFMVSLAELARFAEGKLENVRKSIGEARLRDFANRVIGLPTKYPIFDTENLDDLAGYAPTLGKIVKIRHRLRNACLEYIDNPTKATEKTISDLLLRYYQIETKDLKDEIDYLQSHLKGDMTKGDWKDVRTLLRPKLFTLKTQVAHFVRMARNVSNRMTPEKFLSTDSARALLEGRLAFPTLVEARVHGMSDADVDPALDDSRHVSSKPLGAGKVNTVTLVTYEDGSEYVFKPEAPGRQLMESLTLSQDYSPDQQVAQLNLATQSVAKALGLGDTVPKCSVGAHNGDYGLFMEKVPGQDGMDFADEKAPAPGCLGAGAIRKLKPEQYGQVLGGIIRGLNRLEWLDLITGQGDRHAHNYLLEVLDDLTVSVKGIDNDQCFPAYRTGLSTYVVKGKHAESFNKRCEEVIGEYPPRLQDAVRARIESDPGVTRHPDGSITFDTSKFQAGELFYVANATIGMHGCTLPDFIDEDLYAQLLDLKAGEKRDALLADLARRLPAAALDSARNRLDEAIAHAEKLAREGKVIRKDDFSRQDVQKSILHRELVTPPNPVKPVNGKSPLPSQGDIVRKATRQTRSIFFRDLFEALEKKGWFSA